ncbi:membrane protein [Lysobacter daejeonensis GH1-9]|uniref:Membrane protein n=1 Tax=Lysobacter daejeonensis GH1-9 TaxID=1385517 RepID=A0A0A0EVZ7_9GAMM|nr:membrane protein [Lysobacter daejeonensis GH1-9]
MVTQQRTRRRGWVWAGLAVVWLASLAGVWWWASSTAAPRLPVISAALEEARGRLGHVQSELDELRQREATLSRSDQISRAANKEVQDALAQRDEQIAQLRADLAFYERMIGPGAKPQPLNVHSVAFDPEAPGSWQYEVVLTQSLNRGGVTQGQLQLRIEGMRGGRPATLAWSDLSPGRPPQAFSFRYFQRLKGSVSLPPGFTPQRVRVDVRGGGVALDQSFGWNDISTTGTT